MACEWDGHILDFDFELLSNLPAEAIEQLQTGSNDRFLNTLAQLALDPSFTDVVFAAYEPIFVELCSRWMSHLSHIPPLRVVSAVARLLPYAPSLAIYAKEIIVKRRAGDFVTLFSKDPTALMELQDEVAINLLVTLSRLLAFDRNSFEGLLSPAKLQVLLSNACPAVKILAARVLGQVLGFSETSSASVGNSATGSQPPIGVLDGHEINFRFFSLWEINREQRMTILLKKYRHSRQTDGPQYSSGATVAKSPRKICAADLSPTTTSLGVHLSPRAQSHSLPTSPIVMTPSAQSNLRRVAEAIDTRRPILLTGLSGAGKTMIVNEIAAQLGKDSDLLVLHLNEQTDAKLLIGVYTSDSKAGSFKWQPGVLTTAVKEGRWVFIEDLDRAPVEVVSALLPVLERKELLVPNLGGYIRAADGFQLIASKKTYLNARDEEVVPNDRQIGHGLWTTINISHPTRSDLTHIIQERYPILQRMPEILDIYHAISTVRGASIQAGPRGASRKIGVQELFRFCSRYEALLASNGVKTATDPVPESLFDDILSEAVDCFCAANETLEARDKIAELVSQCLQVSPSRMEYCLYRRLPEFSSSARGIRLGRTRLAKQHRHGANPEIAPARRSQRFAPTAPVLRLMESVAVAVQMGEPCLLVGETGVGKTTIVQELATQVGKRLMVANLSQQSETSDLLGGIKPLSARALAVPLKETFDDLFARALLSGQNSSFTNKIDRAFQRDDWSRMIGLMQKALISVQPYVGRLAEKAEATPAKKRKLLPSKHETLRVGLESFASSLEVFKHHIASGERGLIFDLIEGDLVKAVRTGGWVLLDEINLASPDTLECLADLLQHGPNNRPFLLLSETGKAQKVEAHPDFRIFGAMNPATDIGKRDLPPSIRSRFTELFVHSPDQDPESLGSIVSAYLSDLEKTEKRDARQKPLRQICVDLYQEIRRLEQQNELADGAGESPRFTLRTLTRALMFASDVSALYGIRGALFHGFSMCFLTVLDRESKTRVVALLEQELLRGRSVSTVQRPKRPVDGNDYVNVENYWIHQGKMPTTVPEHYVLTKHVRGNLEDLARATVSRRYPILLQGPTSSGKTSLIEYLANRSGNRFVRINNHEHTDLQEYLGSYVSTSDGLVYQDGVLVHALRKGYWVVLDELNLAPTDVLEALNRLLDDNRELRVPETQEVITPHPNFMLFATQNPPGMYGGRKILSRAFRNRFLELHFNDVPEDELEKILKERCPHVPESFCTRIVQVYRRLSVLRQSDRAFEQKNSFATLRDLFRWALRNADDRYQLAVDGFMLLGERVRDEKERMLVKQVIEEVMKEKIDLREVYAPQRLSVSIDVQDHDQSSIVWTASARRLYVLIERALSNEEPVLLVGDTGCGKTRICQVLAARQGRKLDIVNAHQHTETGDLIGSQRPIRDRSVLEGKLREMVRKVLDEPRIPGGDKSEKLDESLRLFDQLPSESKSKVPMELLTSIEATRARLNMLFEWSDGSLVTAMKEGNFFLLDEISLADDSVLERLNSVLEPERSVLLAEKGSVTATVTASANFCFLATMNPGGDYGKKELSPALRNRFTEIWVPQLSPQEDLLPILATKVADPVKQFVTPMLTFATWFAEKFGNGTSDLSIRDMLAWTEFINKTYEIDPFFAFVHGASMVYIDGLGANPSARFSGTHISIRQQRDRCFQQLAQVLGRDKLAPGYFDLALKEEEGSFGIGPFTISRDEGKARIPTFSFQARTTLSNASRLLRALQLAKPILIEGSPGVGKTALVTALAEATGKQLTRINLSDQTDVMDLFGSDVPAGDENAGHFVWRDAPFLRAMNEGHWVLLDEMNLASQSVLEGLNACLDHRGEVFVPELGKSFKKHNSFTLFAAQNPHSQGGGRKGLPASFVNRFTVVYAEALSAEDYDAICSTAPVVQRAEDVKGIIQDVMQAQDLATVASFEGSPWEFNLRDVLRWLSLVTTKEGLLSRARQSDFKHLMFYDRLRAPGDRRALEKLFQATEGAQNIPHGHYRNLGDHHYLCGFGLLKVSGLIPFQNKRTISIPVTRVLETVAISIQKAWPVLLVGAAGVGKSELLSHLATSVGANLLKLNLNPDSDAFDLIGGYQEADAARDMALFTLSLRDAVRHWYLPMMLHGDRSKPLDDLWETLENAENLQWRDLPSRILDLLDKLRSTLAPEGVDAFASVCKSLKVRAVSDGNLHFEWVDGILVQALNKGWWIELENANLCSSAVLDRLNALLEPGGVLTIHEHSTEDGSPQEITPHPDFRLFLSMDPRHGELSRAMRNRCVEVYLKREDQKPEDLADSVIEAALFRYRAFQAFDWSTLNETESLELSRVCFENLSYGDYPELSSWLAELDKGILHSAGSNLTIIQATSNAFRSLMSTDNAVRQALRLQYDEIVLPVEQRGLLDANLSQSQPLHPAANSAAILRNGTALLPSRRFSNWIEVVYELTTHILVSCFRLSAWLTARPKTLVSSSKFTDRVHELASLVLEANREMISWLDSSIVISHLPKDAERVVCQTSELLDHMSQLFQSSSFEQATFSSLWRLGYLLLQDMDQKVELASLASMWHRQLDKFQRGLQSSSGGSMDLLWRLLKPLISIDPRSARFATELLNVADEFDSILWRSDISLEHTIQMRGSLRKLLSMSQPGMEHAHLQALRETLVQECRDNAYLDEPQYPHFYQEFEGIRQYYYLIDQYSDHQPYLDVLAGRETRTRMSLQKAPPLADYLLCLSDLTGIDTDEAKLITVKQTVPSQILLRLRSVNQRSIGSLNLTLKELDRLGFYVADLTHVFAHNCLQLLNQALMRLQSSVLRAHAIDNAEIFGESSTELQSLLSSIDQVGLLQDLSDKPSASFDAHQFSTMLENFIVPSLRLISPLSSNAHPEEAFGQSAVAWIQFFSALLHLYVPDRPYDPASIAKLKRIHWQRRKERSHAKLTALQQYERYLTGEESNHRCRSVEAELEDFEPLPADSNFARSNESRLGALHNEMANILKSVVQPVHGILKRSTMDQLSETARAIHDAPVIVQNIVHAARRLREFCPEYEDVVSPIISMLHGLHIGLELANFATESAQNSGISPKYLTVNTFGICFEIQRTQKDNTMIGTRMSYPDRLLNIKLLTLKAKASQNSCNTQVPRLQEEFEAVYLNWQQQLQLDQEKHAVKSALYRYTGVQDSSEELESAELQEIFDYEDSRDPSHVLRQVTDHENATAQANTVAELHQKLVRGDSSLSLLLEDAVRAFAEKNTREVPSEHFNVSQPAAKLIPAVLLEIAAKKEQLAPSNEVNGQYDFYHDFNPSQTHRFRDLLFRIRRRFVQLRQSWPEHMAIIDVITAIGVMLHLSVSEPLSKILARAEHLHSLINEWQTVASREFSALEVYDDLTALLIDWRRLELTTWRKLLDFEDAKCVSDARSWWFLAYEMIIHAPMHIDGVAALELYTVQMLAELEKFLSTSSCGLFSQHLQLIDNLARYAKLLAFPYPHMACIISPLSNLLDYYRGYEEDVRIVLDTGRKQLAKDMDQVITLASWKDTNIQALRASAAKSHRKLLKVLRKYRALLGRPVETTVSGAYKLAQLVEDSRIDRYMVQMPETEPLISFIKAQFETWNSLPARITNIDNTYQKMKSLKVAPATASEPSKYLNDFCDALQESISILRNETPSVRSKENESQITQIKTRKKVLFAQTLKMLRLMGLQPNIDVQTLAGQHGLPATFSRAESDPKLTGSQAYLFRFLSNMEHIRAGTKDHSEDLTDQEVNRSLGLLEAILRTILVQRRALVKHLKGVKDLDKVLTELYSLQECSIDRSKADLCLKRSEDLDSSTGGLKWTCALLEFTDKILEKHEGLGHLQFTELRNDLYSRRDELIKTEGRVSKILPLPFGLESRNQSATHASAAQSIRRLRSDLRLWSQRDPRVAYVLDEVHSGITPELFQQVAPVIQTNGTQETSPASEDDATSEIIKVVDTVLQKLQRIDSAVGDLRLTTDDPNWLIRADRCFADVDMLLEVGKVATDLLQALHLLQHCSEGDLTKLAAFYTLLGKILFAFRLKIGDFLNQWHELHRSVCQTAQVLSDIFKQMLLHGLCLPSQKSTEKGESEQVEEGTGLGEGEGGDDISKDIGDDEDLSELANQKDEPLKDQELEAEKDAVDMADEDLDAEAEANEAGEDSKEKVDEEKDEGDGPDDEVGSVNSAEDDAIDEKFWDGEKNDEQDTKDASKDREGKHEEQATAENKNDQGHEEVEENHEENGEMADSKEAVESNELDQFTQEGENLDLPDDMDIDGNKEDAVSDDGLMDEDSDHDLDDADGAAEDEAGPLEAEDGSSPGKETVDEVDVEMDREEGSEADPRSDEENEQGANALEEQNAVQEQQPDEGNDENDAQPGTGWSMQEQQTEMPKESDAQEQDNVEDKDVGKSSAANLGEDDQSGETNQAAAGEEKAEQDTAPENSDDQPFKRLGDALEKWHRLNKEIQNASKEDRTKAEEQDVNGQEFEHLPDEEAPADAQALGTATEEQARVLGREAMEAAIEQDAPTPMHEDFEESTDGDGMEDLLRDPGTESTQHGDKESLLVQDMMKMDPSFTGDGNLEQEVEDQPADTPSAPNNQALELPVHDAETAQQIWAHCEAATRELALSLTEQLRLILAPTQASKLRGDFRTGKRLNIKRIIPYIASQYKRDKIWMRRTIPSKRSYQVLLAVDDSRSMSEGGGGRLALEALALISRSLSMLEVGQICVVGFGAEVKVAHAFDQPFSSEAGVRAFQQFSFQQTSTDVKKLVGASLDIFRNARATAPAGAADLWQLQLIISDGVCDERDAVRRLVRQAQQERVMTVFVIVDALRGEDDSILRMQEASFETDADGNQKPIIRRYLDSFPFSVYLIVRNVRDLPNVLATALRQWFAEVAES